MKAINVRYNSPPKCFTSADINIQTAKMKYQTLPSCFSALALLAAVVPTQAFTAPYTAGDLLVGFSTLSGSTRGSNVYVVNLGPAATFRDATSTLTLSLGDLNADLVARFGASWSSSTTLNWGIVGSPSNTAVVSSDSVATLYASQVQSSAGTAGSGYTIASATNRTSASTRIQTFITAYKGYTVTANSNFGVAQSKADAQDWTSYLTPGGDNSNTANGASDFGAFSNIEGGITKTLGLYRIADGFAGSYEGYFSISSAGVISFTPSSSASAQGYTSWATANVAGQAASLDYDKDGISNGVEFFMGTDATVANAAPAISNGAISWSRNRNNAVGTYTIQTSTDLATWSDVAATSTTASAVSYTLPAGQTRVFARLSVNP